MNASDDDTIFRWIRKPDVLSGYLLLKDIEAEGVGQEDDCRKNYQLSIFKIDFDPQS